MSNRNTPSNKVYQKKKKEKKAKLKLYDGQPRLNEGRKLKQNVLDIGGII